MDIDVAEPTSLGWELLLYINSQWWIGTCRLHLSLGMLMFSTEKEGKRQEKDQSGQKTLSLSF